MDEFEAALEAMAKDGPFRVQEVRPVAGATPAYGFAVIFGPREIVRHYTRDEAERVARGLNAWLSSLGVPS